MSKISNEDIKKAGKCFYSSLNYILRNIAGESILVSVGAGVADFCGIVKLNTSAKVIWENLKSGASKDELIQTLVDTFGIEREKAEADVEKSLELLNDREMITCE